MDVKDLRERIAEAIENKRKPFLVVATAGTTVFGAFDPIDDIADLCEEFKLWLHVDVSTYSVGGFGRIIISSPILISKPMPTLECRIYINF